MASSAFVSVIIPVFNGRDTLKPCLTALNQTTYPHWECIVVNDCSNDDSAKVAAQMGAVVMNLSAQKGPAVARNQGAREAKGDLLFFIDADILVKPDTIAQVVATLKAHPTIVACFGSYDDQPTQPNFLSQYRNLQHHYVHQQSNPEASTFWSGCGAIKKEIFWQLGGFSETLFARPSIEDIELGYRLKTAGYHIRLEKQLQVTHMKRWQPQQMIVTDVRDRAIPWTKLIMQDGAVPNDLNLQTSQRVSTAVVFTGLLGLLLMPFRFVRYLSWLLTVTAVAILWLLNRDFYNYLRQKRNTRFMLQAIPWHWLYFLYSGLSFIYVILFHWLPTKLLSRQR